jgi:hypothetical protein
MPLPQEMEAFLVAAHQHATVALDRTFSTVRARHATGISAERENEICEALKRAEPPLMQDLRYPEARLTDAGAQRVKQLLQDEPPLSRA